MRVNVKSILEISKVMVEDSHIVYTSGRHGKVYFDKDRLYLNPFHAADLCQAMAHAIPLWAKPQVVVGPAVGAVVLGTRLAEQLNVSMHRRSKSVFARKDTEGNFVFKGSYPKEIEGKKVWVVEDVLNTGDSAHKVIEATRKAGGEVQGLSVICNRGELTKNDFDIPYLFSLVDLKAESWPADDCPLCRKEVPINTDVGHGAKFLAELAEQ
jgi:orotate phosphoribosyltransferase